MHLSAGTRLSAARFLTPPANHDSLRANCSVRISIAQAQNLGVEGQRKNYSSKLGNKK